MPLFCGQVHRRRPNRYDFFSTWPAVAQVLQHLLSSSASPSPDVNHAPLGSKEQTSLPAFPTKIEAKLTLTTSSAGHMCLSIFPSAFSITNSADPLQKIRKKTSELNFIFPPVQLICQLQVKEYFFIKITCCLKIVKLKNQ